MKMTTMIVVILICIFCSSFSRAQGIRFEKGLTWTEIVAKAKAERKFIFLDCYTTWCAPCKFMSQYVFTQKAVGDYINTHFISFALQMDQTGLDPNEVQRNYSLAKEIARDFGVDSFPTYLFFDSSGTVMHRVVGATGKDGDIFIKKASNAFIPDSQYYSLINLYKEHLDDSSAIRMALVRAVKQYDQKNEATLAGLYLHFLHWPYSRADFSLLLASLHSTKDTLFGVLLQAPKKFDSLAGQGRVEDKLKQFVFLNEIVPLFDTSQNTPLYWSVISENLRRKYPSLGAALITQCQQGFTSCVTREIRLYISADGRDMPDWSNISSRLKARFPDYDCNQLLMQQKVHYYAGRKQWGQCDTAIVSLLARFRGDLSAAEMNYIAWDCVFLHLYDKELLSQVIDLYHSLVRNYPEADYRYMDTYANILYKSGDSNEAIIWERRAIGKLQEEGPQSDPPSLKEFKITLQKMQAGEKTWEQRDAKGDYL